jgi:4-amino-4-deoxy-L-arabinose transferase-like glycosyltransferase
VLDAGAADGASGRFVGLARLHVSPTALVVLSAVLAGILLRAAVHWSSLGILDGDEAVWGLMVRHALDGELTAFYWGQGYGGTQEVLLTVPLFALMGTSVLAMRAVPVLLTAVAALLVWRIGRRTIGEPAATFAAALFWVWPPYLIWKSDRAHGFYGSGLVLAALVLLLVLRLVERRSRRDMALLGLVLGLAWWQTPQVVPIAVPALVFLGLSRPHAYRDAWPAVPLALLGALPWIISNVQHDWWSFRIDSGDTPYGSRLRGFFSATFPMTIGLRIPFTSEWLLGRALSAVIYAGLLIALAAFLWRRRRTNIALLFAVAIAYPFLYAISPSTWLVDEPRYVLLLVPVLVLLFAQGLTTVRRGALAVAAAAALSAFVMVRLSSSAEYDRRADGLFVPSDFKPLIAALERREIDRVFSSYWIAYRLNFETRERLIASEYLLGTLSARGGRVLPRLPTRPNDNRHRPYDTAVRAAPNPAWVLLPGTGDDVDARQLLLRTGYIRSLVEGFALYELRR